MPYTPQDFQKAIDRKDAPLLLRILEERDVRGNPTIKFNDHLFQRHPGARPGRGELTNIVCYLTEGNFFTTKKSSVFNSREQEFQKTSQIWNILLASRDANGNPLIDWNAKTHYFPSRTVINSIMECPLEAHEKRALIERLLNLRRADGRRFFCINCTNEGEDDFDILQYAVRTKDIELLRILIDLRNHNNTFPIGLNHDISSSKNSDFDHPYAKNSKLPGAFTILDYVLDGNQGNPSPISDLLVQAGAVRWNKGEAEADCFLLRVPLTDQPISYEFLRQQCEEAYKKISVLFKIAYVQCGEELYYVNTYKKEFIKIPMSLEKFQEFDTQMWDIPLCEGVLILKQDTINLEDIPKNHIVLHTQERNRVASWIENGKIKTQDYLEDFNNMANEAYKKAENGAIIKEDIWNGRDRRNYLIKSVIKSCGFRTSDYRGNKNCFRLANSDLEKITAITGHIHRILRRVEKELDPLPVTAANLEEKVSSEIDRFLVNPQNIHDPLIENTVDNSISLLKKRYPNFPRIEDKSAFERLTKEIQQHIDAHARFPYYQPEAVANIQKGFNYIKNPMVAGALHAPSGLSMLQILFLVWEGAKDEEALPEKQVIPDVKKFIEARKTALLDKFLFIQTTYSSGVVTACIGGTRNQIVDALNTSHPDVRIIRTKGEANVAAIEAAHFFEERELKKLPMLDQRKILASWHELSDSESKTRETSAAYQFHYSIRPQLVSFLEEKFTNIASQKTLDNLTSLECSEEQGIPFHSMRRPIVHQHLDALILKIEGIVTPQGNIFEDKLTTFIQKEARTVFDDEKRGYPEDYECLKQQCQFYQKAKETMHALYLSFLIKKLSVKPNASLKSSFEAYVESGISSLDKFPNPIKEIVEEYKGSFDQVLLNQECLRECQLLYNQVQLLFSTIQALRTHADHFSEDIPEEKKAKDISKILCNSLNNQLSLFFSQNASKAIQNLDLWKKTRKVTYKKFLLEAHGHIDKAKPILSTHRGMGDLLTNLFIGLTGIGLLFLIVKAGYSYAKTGKVTLFGKTASSGKVEKIEATLNNIKLH